MSEQLFGRLVHLCVGFVPGWFSRKIEWRRREAETGGFEPFAVIITSDVRLALVDTLNTTPRKYAEMKENIKNILGRDVSDGSLAWHIEKLKGIGVIEKQGDTWHLTEPGRKLQEKISSIDKEEENVNE